MYLNHTAALGILTAVALIVSCSGKNDVPSEYAGYRRVPLQGSITKVQPMTGIAYWTDSPKRSSGAIALEFSYMLYNDVCKGKDDYDWTPVDELLESVAARGHQAILRFRYTYVGKKCAVPDYIKAMPGYEETVGQSERKTTYFPDWRSEELQRFHLDFYRRFAERYDNDPRIAFIETGFGLWAEYHIYDGPFIMGQTFPSKVFQAEFIGDMKKWFKDTPWCISIDAADETYSPFVEQPALLNEKFGNFDDSFMCSSHDDYNHTSWKFFGEDRYKQSPFGGEFSYYTEADQEHCLDKAGMYGRTFEGEVAKYHMTFIIGNDQPYHQSEARIKEASMSMGYKFRIDDFRVKDDKAAVCISNIGVAPIYRDAYVAVGGKRDDWSLRQLMPGTQKWIEIDGTDPSNPTLSIECDHLVSGQRIDYDAEIR